LRIRTRPVDRFSVDLDEFLPELRVRFAELLAERNLG